MVMSRVPPRMVVALGRAGTRIRSAAVHPISTIGRLAADRAGARPYHRSKLIANPGASSPKRSQTVH
jgi:hypothetical protein